MLAEYGDELAEPTAVPAVNITTRERPFGVYSSNELKSSRTQWPTDDLDWAQIVELRRRARDDHRRDPGAGRTARSSARDR